MIALATKASLAAASGVHSYKLIKAGVECTSTDHWYGNFDTLDECADRCARDKERCHFFLYGTETGNEEHPAWSNKGDCYTEDTTTAECAEGWEDDTFDFYELSASWIGCTFERAANYNSAATIDDGSCREWETCVEDPITTECDKWRKWCEKPCDDGDLRDWDGRTPRNEGYRNRVNDTAHAPRVAAGAIQIDGDLRDWDATGAMPYTDVAFADTFGREVSFESYGGGKWYGPKDFSMTWRVAWDDDHFYLAADVTDDKFTAAAHEEKRRNYCWKTGMQVAFEVAGPHDASSQGRLQAKRSADLSVSRFILMNLGLYPGATSCLSVPNTSVAATRPDEAQYAHGGTKPTAAAAAGRECCVEYERHNGAGWLRLARAAVLRNENARRTVFELALARRDLQPAERARDWKQGLKFGFSMLVNDGDDEPEQRGWGGFYPHAIVQGYNGGEKEPAKAGLVHFAGFAHASGGGGGGGGGGSFFLGVFLTLLGVAGWVAFRRWREGGVEALKAMVPETVARALPASWGVGGGSVSRTMDSSHPAHLGAANPTRPGGSARTPLSGADFSVTVGAYTAPELPVAAAVPVEGPA